MPVELGGGAAVVVVAGGAVVVVVGGAVVVAAVVVVVVCVVVVAGTVVAVVVVLFGRVVVDDGAAVVDEEAGGAVDAVVEGWLVDVAEGLVEPAVVVVAVPSVLGAGGAGPAVVDVVVPVGGDVTAGVGFPVEEVVVVVPRRPRGGDVAVLEARRVVVVLWVPAVEVVDFPEVFAGREVVVVLRGSGRVLEVVVDLGRFACAVVVVDLGAPLWVVSEVLSVTRCLGLSRGTAAGGLLTRWRGWGRWPVAGAFLALRGVVPPVLRGRLVGVVSRSLAGAPE